jgi:mannose-1-phosphate guanylyltransferase
MAMENLYPTILVGGASSRMWPASGPNRPKWALRLFAGKTLLEGAWERACACAPLENCLVVTNRNQAALVRRCLPDLPPENLLEEPEVRDTSGAVAFATGKVLSRNPAGVMLVLPGDHLISPLDAFVRCVAIGVEAATVPGRMVTLGIQPRAPATCYGYIHRGAPLATDKPVIAAGRSSEPRLYRVLEFREKPDAATAERYLASGAYDWNGGIFLWRADALRDEMKRQMPEHARMIDALTKCQSSADWDACSQKFYSNLTRKSLDYGVMENARDVAVVSATFVWDDIGSWSAVRDHLPRVAAMRMDDESDSEATSESNAAPDDTKVLARHAHGNIVWAPGRVVSLIGVENLAVIDGPDGLLVCNLAQDQEVRNVCRLAGGESTRIVPSLNALKDDAR